MTFIKKRDVIIIAVIVVIGLGLWMIFNGILARTGNVAEIYYKTQLVKTVPLTAGKSETFSLEQVPNVVFEVYSDGSIAFIKSDCPDQVCVRTGHLHNAGQFAACLPNQLYIKIVSRNPNNSDAPDMIING